MIQEACARHTTGERLAQVRNNEARLDFAQAGLLVLLASGLKSFSLKMKEVHMWTLTQPYFGLLCALLIFTFFPVRLEGQTWQPTKPVEFIIPAGTGGGADVMARLISPIIEKNKLSPQPFIPINKSGGAGAEGFTYVKGKKGDAHTIIITLSNLFTTPLATGVPFNWKDLSPLARLALDEFILWVNAETPYKSAREYIDAVKKSPATFKMGGTGSKTGRSDNYGPDGTGSRAQVPLCAVQGRRGGLRQLGGQTGGFDGQQPRRMRRPLEGGESEASRGFRLGAAELGSRLGRNSDDKRSSGLGHPIPDAPRYLRATGYAKGSSQLVYQPAQKSLRLKGV